ncbi:MAG: VirB3 family type IV secretion system protein [Acetobacteraceae bacterium]
MDDEELIPAPLHIGATRPALIWGVPYVLAILIIQLGGIAGVFHWAGPVIALPAWFLAAILVRRDYNAPRVWALWYGTSARAWDAEVWGGSSMAPMPLHLPRRFRGIAR